MRKFSKILENKDELLSRISVSDDEIEEMLIDLIDIGYWHTTDSVYISTSTGYPHRSKRDSKEYFPGLEIDIRRDIDDDKGDKRNWNGGVYFEDDLSILDAVYNSIHRIKSMLSDRASIYYSIRNINEIQIRIIFNKELSGYAIDYEKVEDNIKDLEIFKNNLRHERYGDLDGERIEGYYINLNQSWGRSDGNIHELKIALGNEFPLYTSIDNKETDNKSELWRIFKIWCKKFFDKTNEEGNLRLKEVNRVNRGKSNPGYVIVEKGKDNIELMDIICWYEEQETKKITTEKGGFLRKDKVVEYDVYELYFRVKIIENR